MKMPLCILFSVLFLSTVDRLSAATVEEARKAYNVEILLIEAKGQDRIDDLYRKYVAGVERLRDRFQAAGDLDNTVKANEEIESAEKDQKPGTKDFPGIERMREVLAEEEARIRAEVITRKVPVKTALVEKMDLIKIELTKAGKLDQARAVRDEILALQAELESAPLEVPDLAEPSPPGSSPGSTPRLVSTSGGSLPVLPSGKMGGEVRLEPGIYRLKEAIQGGDGGIKDHPHRFVQLFVPEGTSIERERIYIDEGKVFIEGSRFREIELAADLGGHYDARRSLFDEVTFRKGGAWMSGYSAKFVFDNCVFHESNFLRPGKPAMGFKITRSTFVNCEFDPVAFKKEDDATVEAQREWLTIENCHFIGCEIPQSLAYLTKNCLFEDCRFGPFDETMPLKTKMEVTLYHGAEPFDPPPDRDEGLFKVEDGRNRVGRFGASIGYEITAGKLDFR